MLKLLNFLHKSAIKNPGSDAREKLLKQAVHQTDIIHQEYGDEWKRTCFTIMFDGRTDKKKVFYL